MQWTKLNDLSKKALKEFEQDFERAHRFKYSRKPRYFVDENLGAGTTALLRAWGKNVTDVWEEDLVGKGDEHIWRFCHRYRRIILSHDDDFMRERIFPIRRCYGLAIFPHKEGGEAAFVEKLGHFVAVMDPASGFIYQKKLIIRENGHWELHFIGQSGAIEKSLYDLNDRNHVFELVSP